MVAPEKKVVSIITSKINKKREKDVGRERRHHNELQNYASFLKKILLTQIIYVHIQLYFKRLRAFLVEASLMTQRKK